MLTSFDVVVPVLNEERALPSSIERLRRFIERELERFRWRIVIADNGSTDSTPQVAERLCRQYENLDYIHLDQRGRGGALRAAWMQSQADIVAYMDVDLSTDLNAFPTLLDAIAVEGYDIAIGSRLKKGARVVGRPLLREIISRAYSMTFRSMFLTGFRDAQCGFKALKREAAHSLVPLVADTGWFFDSELLILAESNGFRIKEVPVRWTDDPDSRVRIASTALDDLRGLLRLRFGGLRRASRLLKDQP